MKGNGNTGTWKKNAIFSKNDNIIPPPTLLSAARKRSQASPFANGSHDIVYDAAKSTAAVWIIPCTAQNEILVYDVHELIFKYKL